jgi:hypothetical protein
MKTLFSFMFLWVTLLWVAVVPTVHAADAVLTWTANTETDLAGYKFYRSNQNCTNQGPLAPLIVNGAPAQVGKVTTFTDANLPPFDGTYCWEITAFDTAANESTRSNRVSKAVNTVPPVAPAGLSVAIQ